MSGKLRSRSAVLAMTCLATAVVLISGCSSKEEGRFYDDKDDFSIRFPADWETAENVMGMRVVSRSPLEGPDDQFQENVGVVVEKLPAAMTPRAYTDAATQLLEKILTDYEEKGRGATTVGGEDAQWLLYAHRMGQVRAVVLNQIVVKNKKAYIIAASALPETFNAWRPRLEAVLGTFRFE